MCLSNLLITSTFDDPSLCGVASCALQVIWDPETKRPALKMSYVLSWRAKPLQVRASVHGPAHAIPPLITAGLPAPASGLLQLRFQPLRLASATQHVISMNAVSFAGAAAVLRRLLLAGGGPQAAAQARGVRRPAAQVQPAACRAMLPAGGACLAVMCIAALRMHP